jgi:hypothetical protein
MRPRSGLENSGEKHEQGFGNGCVGCGVRVRRYGGSGEVLQAGPDEVLQGSEDHVLRRRSDVRRSVFDVCPGRSVVCRSVFDVCSDVRCSGRVRRCSVVRRSVCFGRLLGDGPDGRSGSGRCSDAGPGPGRCPGCLGQANGTACFEPRLSEWLGRIRSKIQTNPSGLGREGLLLLWVGIVLRRIDGPYGASFHRQTVGWALRL